MKNIGVHLEELSPLPRKAFTTEKRKRNISRSTILTNFPRKRKVALFSAQTSALKKKVPRMLAVSKKKIAPKPFLEDVYSCLVCGDDTEEDWIQCCKCKN